MERLTTTSKKGGVALTFDLDITCNKSEIMKILKLAEKLKEYEDLEEQGKLPCAVGDIVYRINKGKQEPVIPMRVIGIAIRNENELIIQAKDIDDDNHNLYSKDSIGKKVFLTKEEAEAELKGFAGEWRKRKNERERNSKDGS